MLTVNIPHVLVFYEHAMLFLLELLFQGYPQYAQFWDSLKSFVHSSFVEQKLVFWSNIQVFGSTCGPHGSNIRIYKAFDGHNLSQIIQTRIKFLCNFARFVP